MGQFDSYQPNRKPWRSDLLERDGMGTAELLGIAALVVAAMALPTVFQMFWGRPNITFLFTRQESERDTLLLVHLCNYPIGNRFLSGIGVRREDAHFHVRLTVKDSVGNQVLDYMEPPPSSGNPFEQNLFHLHAGPSPKTLEILGANGQCARIYYEERAEGYKELSAGSYSLRLDVWVGEKIFFEERIFVVTEDSIKSYWADA